MRLTQRCGSSRLCLSGTARPLPRYRAIGERARSRPCSDQLHHHRGHDPSGGTETLAIQLIRVLYDATDGKPAQWRSLGGLNVPEMPGVVRYALTRGWLMVEDGHRVCLTDAGRRLNI